MSDDPAVEAAYRALPYEREADEITADIAVNAAREALRPIRELHKRLSATAPLEDAEVEHGMHMVLDALAPLIHTTEELQ